MRTTNKKSTRSHGWLLVVECYDSQSMADTKYTVRRVFRTKTRATRFAKILEKTLGIAKKHLHFLKVEVE